MPSDPIIDLQLAPGAAQPDPPPTFRKAARAAFDEMVKAAGTTVYRMPTSAGLYVRQYLGSFEPERDAVLEALKRGVPDRIAQRETKDGYRQFLADEGAKLAADAGLDPGLAKGAVECWAAGVGRRLGPPPPPTAAEVKQERAEVSARKLHWAMTGVVAAGGFVGGFVGIIFRFGMMLFTHVAVDATDRTYGGPETGVFVLAVVLILCGLMGGVAGGAGAAAGWLMGRGDAKPWTGFGAAAGATFTTGAVASAISGPTPVAAVIILITAFTAAYGAAASGGYRK